MGSATDRRGPGALWLAGVLGVACGLAYGVHQDVTEVAQVLAGTVDYPAGNPYEASHRATWTCAVQVSALALRLGVPEHLISAGWCALSGGVFFQAMAWIVWSLSGRASLAVATPLLVILYGALGYGPRYPVEVVGFPFSFGVIGLALAVLVPACLAVGRRRAAAFLLGLGPSLHAPFGLFSVGVAALLVAALHRRRPALAAELRGLFGWFFVGGLVTLASFGVFLATAPEVPVVEPELAEKFFRTFLAHWDMHRGPVPLDVPGPWLVLAAAALCWRQLGSGRSRGDEGDLLFAYAGIAASTGLGLAALTYANDALPRALLVFILGRFVNVALVLLPCLVLGTLGGSEKGRRCLAVTTWGGLALMLFLGPVVVQGGSWMGLLLLVLAVFLGAGDAEARREPEAERRAHPALAAGLLLNAAVFLLAVALFVRKSGPAYPDHRNDPLFAAAAAGEGPILTAGALRHVQLRSHRPVILCGASLDGVMSVPAAFSVYPRILRELYEVDFLDPKGPTHVPHRPHLDKAGHRAAWEGRSRAEWRRLASEFGFTAVLTYGGWELDLPLVAEDEDHRLFAVAEESP